eukprot:gene15473-21728_t
MGVADGRYAAPRGPAHADLCAQLAALRRVVDQLMVVQPG